MTTLLMVILSWDKLTIATNSTFQLLNKKIMYSSKDYFQKYLGQFDE